VSLPATGQNMRQENTRLSGKNETKGGEQQ